MVEQELHYYKELDSLRREHRELDRKITALTYQTVMGKEFMLKQLKKERLQLRDRISKLEEFIYPDIIA